MESEFVVIENWSITSQFEDAYKAPELQPIRLCGNVYGHPDEHQDGKEVLTSPIVEVDLLKKVIKTKSRLYHLGSPRKSWVEWMKTQSNIDPEYITLVEGCVEIPI